MIFILISKAHHVNGRTLKNINFQLLGEYTSSWYIDTEAEFSTLKRKTNIEKEKDIICTTNVERDYF